jgi:cytochrome c biogenesis protein CcmG/thiol:disulfide interchange protein DsbE
MTTRALIGMFLTAGAAILLSVRMSHGRNGDSLVGSRPASAACSGGKRCLPDVPWLDTQGITHTRAELAGKVVVVNFWATWCAPCREEMPALQRVAASEPNVVVLEVDLMEPGDKARSFLDSLGLDRLQPVLDSDGATTRRFGVLTLPSTFFVDKDGVIRHLELRQMTEAMIRTGIQKAR